MIIFFNPDKPTLPANHTSSEFQLSSVELTSNATCKQASSALGIKWVSSVYGAPASVNETQDLIIH